MEKKDNILQGERTGTKYPEAFFYITICRLVDRHAQKNTFNHQTYSYLLKIRKF